MFRPRVIPVLLLRGQGLVKSRRFRSERYIGDPINAVRIFNQLKADELILLDVSASKEGRVMSSELVAEIADEADMPFAVGGGIRSIGQIRALLSAGAEKVVINSYAAENPAFIGEAASVFGSSALVVCIDSKKTLFGRRRTWTFGGSRRTAYAPEEFAALMEHYGAGELIVQSIDHDGMMNGYDLESVRTISERVSIPVIALGGAGSMEHLRQAYVEAHATGLAAGSLFVFHGNGGGVLINYPDRADLPF